MHGRAPTVEARWRLTNTWESCSSRWDATANPDPIQTRREWRWEGRVRSSPGSLHRSKPCKRYPRLKPSSRYCSILCLSLIGKTSISPFEATSLLYSTTQKCGTFLGPKKTKETRARICKPFQETRNRFSVWRARTTALFDGPPGCLGWRN
jgi:hypothetical protein